ncbi:MAG: hypothetical protein ACRESZ_06655 [Methylococcales bacterium]
MRFIHRFDRISGLIFVTLLIVTQSLAPLIHGHGGYDEPIRGFHMPGFENFSRIAGCVDIGSVHGFQYFGFELIIGVASGIETKHRIASGFDAKDLVAPPAPDFETTAIFTGAPSDNRFERAPIQRGWTHRPSRAPPHTSA